MWLVIVIVHFTMVMLLNLQYLNCLVPRIKMAISRDFILRQF